MEESETLDYRTKFIKDVISDLKSEGRGFVYNESQLEDIKKIMNIEVTKMMAFVYGSKL